MKIDCLQTQQVANAGQVSNVRQIPNAGQESNTRTDPQAERFGPGESVCQVANYD